MVMICRLVVYGFWGHGLLFGDVGFPVGGRTVEARFRVDVVGESVVVVVDVGTFPEFSGF